MQPRSRRQLNPAAPTPAYEAFNLLSFQVRRSSLTVCQGGGKGKPTGSPSILSNKSIKDRRISSPRRKRKSGNKLDDDLRATGYKVIANSGTYGSFVEATPEEIDPDARPRPTTVTVRGLREFVLRRFPRSLRHRLSAASYSKNGLYNIQRATIRKDRRTYERYCHI